VLGISGDVFVNRHGGEGGGLSGKEKKAAAGGRLTAKAAEKPAITERVTGGAAFGIQMKRKPRRCAGIFSKRKGLEHLRYSSPERDHSA
jgi:hypothetical protein